MRTQILNAILDQDPVRGLTHNFYKYPARFSPQFARGIIQEFSKPGDVVYDPFVGGGTTLVEARAMGRNAIGTDVNALAVFVSRVKTTRLLRADAVALRSWFTKILPTISPRRESRRPADWIESGYQANIDTKNTWVIRKAIELFIEDIELLEVSRQRDFARCVLLSTAQWALDCRDTIPSLDEFRETFGDKLDKMILGMLDFSTLARVNGIESKIGKDGVVCLQRSAAEAYKIPILKKNPPSLIVTSPPYPGTHVLYHRWQVQGRRETKAPYWIANELDGQFAPFYCMGERKRKNNPDYFENLQTIFGALAQAVTSETVIVQMLAFPNPSWQLPEYLKVMREVGFRELKKAPRLNDGRMWRNIPNRRFYAGPNSFGTSQEVVLFHQLRG